MEAIKYIFDRLEGRPAQSLDVNRNTNIQVEYRSYEEIRLELLQRGIDVERLP
jgi:hypothetical protein